MKQLGSIAAAAAVAAMPCAYSTPTAKVPAPPNPTTSQVLGDTKDASLLWVLPPVSGRAGGAKLSIETPEATCDSMTNIVESARSYSHQIRILAAQREKVLARLDEMSDKTTADALNLFTQTEKINAAILAAYSTMNALISSDARNHGGTLLISYVHEIDRNLARIKEANPDSSVLPVQTFNSRLFFSAPGSVQDGVDISLLPIINSYSVAGVRAADLAKTQVQIAPRIDVTLSLTRIGACMMAYPAKFSTRTVPRFGMTAIYEYPYAFKTSVRASYNLKNIYNFLKSSGTSGGLFTSSSWSKTLESNWGESALKFNWEQEDPESKVSPADRLEIQRMVKADLLASIDKLLLAKADIKPADAANPGPHGATVLASGLDKTCAANGYCAAASIALKTLDAIFGSSSMSTEVQKRLDVTATYSSNETTARYVTQGISYAASE